MRGKAGLLPLPPSALLSFIAKVAIIKRKFTESFKSVLKSWWRYYAIRT